MWSVPRCNKQDKSPASKDVNTEAEGGRALENITGRQQVKMQQAKKTSYML
jgi:hypothetical protein